MTSANAGVPPASPFSKTPAGPPAITRTQMQSPILQAALTPQPLLKSPSSLLDLILPPRVSSHLKGVAASVMPSSIPPPPPAPTDPKDDKSLYGRFKLASALWCRSPVSGASSALLTAYLFPFARMLRDERPRILPRPAFLPVTSLTFALSAYMSYLGFGRDAAGVLSSWSMIYLLMNGRNSDKNGRIAISRPGGGPRVLALGVMAWNAVSGSGVFLFGWGGGRGGGGWRMKMPEAEAAV
ncbi:hypothetical protein H072_10843 [Dactylellina haptotyla CBS 200.50]|uniref:Uncharacterized protein n=1 Tax=Dactylellina haptotyla (strain CBS 200.50) TaxID=1284197 RepID=S8B9G6_DACHA|nr:hypothetical protein H072_10843 [Dactylellina haptotyla CBS 200.50]